MGKEYTQVTIEERCEIARLLAKGYSGQIAAGVDRPPSTVAREERNHGPKGNLGCRPHARRWRGSRLERDGPLREKVFSRLGQGWSPEQVAGRLALDEGRQVLSHESIYRFIYSQMARKKDYSWRHYLPRAKSKRGFRGRRGGSPATHIAHRVPLNQRPPAAADRATFGHWEGDRCTSATTAPRSWLSLSATPAWCSSPASPASMPTSPPTPSPACWRVAPDHHLRQRHRVRPPLPPPPPGHPDLLLRYLLPMAEGGCGERHRAYAPHPAPEDGPGVVVREAVYSAGAGI